MRIEAERRRLGLSLRQADELDPPKEATAEQTEATESDTTVATLEPSTPSLETAAPSLEAALPQQEHRNKRERTERERENPLLTGITKEDEGEMTAMAEAFRAAARQRTKEGSEDSE